jgi:hypothetical protein
MPIGRRKENFSLSEEFLQKNLPGPEPGSPKIAAPVSRPAVLRTSCPSAASPGLELCLESESVGIQARSLENFTVQEKSKL